MLGVNNISNTGELTMDSITQKARVRLSALKFVNYFISTRQLMNALGIWELFRNTVPIDDFPFKIYKVQTDNGFEFTKRFSRTKEGDRALFEEQLLESVGKV